MIDLNELKTAVDNGQVDREQVRVVLRDGQIVDFLTVDDEPRVNEEVRTMPILEVLEHVFSENK
ncbi:hypothetical protein [Streptococcus minor]|uniref:competence regulator inhibitor paratox n=1 Tax=Streptococcus minor TaxID=229549 RepID=UPI00035E299F|nr:hypothetical protein [Streptococcus minor]